MASRRMLDGLAAPALGGFLALTASVGFSTSARAVDFGFGPVDFGLGAVPYGFGAAPLSPAEAPEDIGIPCSIGAPPWTPPWERRITAQILPWPSVWLGHFTGGRPDPVFYGQIDWRDEKVCFASKAKCQAWIKELRHAYHSPEGYWTCMVLR